MPAIVLLAVCVGVLSAGWFGQDSFESNLPDKYAWRADFAVKNR